MTWYTGRVYGTQTHYDDDNFILLCVGFFVLYILLLLFIPIVCKVNRHYRVFALSSTKNARLPDGMYKNKPAK